MLKKTIKYEDLEGNPIEGVFYFNISKAEAIKFQAKLEGGLERVLLGMVEARDAEGLMEEFEKIAKFAYGVKSQDGIRFIKNEKVWEDFRYSLAWDEFVMEILQNEDAASDFVMAILPTEIVNAFKREQQTTTTKDPTVKPAPPFPPKSS